MCIRDSRYGEQQPQREARSYSDGAFWLSRGCCRCCRDACPERLHDGPDHFREWRVVYELGSRVCTARLSRLRLVNVAEQNNPQTRVAWENGKARTADLGVAQSPLYPTLAVAALAGSTRLDIFFGPSFQGKPSFDPLSSGSRVEKNLHRR